MAELIEALNISSTPWLNALISALIFIALAKLADLFIDKVARRFTKFTTSDLDDIIIDAVHRPVYHTISFVGVLLAIQYLEPSDKYVFWIDSTLYTLILVIWAITAVRLSSSLLEVTFNRVSDVTGLGRDVLPLVENVTKIALVAAALMIGFSIWKINITPLLASAGILGAAVAFASKDTIANLFGGVSVYMDRPFKVGDYIVLDGTQRGEVVSIGLRSTRILTRDNVQITVPNSIIAVSKVVNESAPVPMFRVRVPIGVAYGSDIEKVEAVLLEIARSNENIVSDPDPRVRFRAFGDSALNIELLCWAREPSMRGLTVHQLNSAIYKRFMSEGITIPFPQRDVHIIKEN